MQADDRFISPNETYQRTSVSPREQDRKPGFPRAVKIGEGPNGRKVRLLSEVIAWQEAQLARREAEQQALDNTQPPPPPDSKPAPARRPRGRPRKSPLPSNLTAEVTA